MGIGFMVSSPWLMVNPRFRGGLAIVYILDDLLD